MPFAPHQTRRELIRSGARASTRKLCPLGRASGLLGSAAAVRPPRSPSLRLSPSGREFPEKIVSRFQPLNRRGKTSNIQHPTSNTQWRQLVPALDVGRSVLEVGCSLGSWRGRAPSPALENADARRLGCQKWDAARGALNRPSAFVVLAGNYERTMNGTVVSSEGQWVADLMAFS